MALGWLPSSELFTVEVWGAIRSRLFLTHLLYLVLRRIFGGFTTCCMARG